jgi:electron transport complex protein RnfB
MSLIQRIDALLPQTQCGKCGHPGCKPYAQGIVDGEPINKCPPGGEETIVALAELLKIPVLELDISRGPAPPQIAFIREAECIGCTKCIQACPVDAIVGAAKLMHTVLIDECTGCDLCVAPCPVDCIEMHPLPANTIPVVGGLAFDLEEQRARAEKRDHARQRFERRNQRLLHEEQQKQAEREARAARAAQPQVSTADPVQAALERVRAQKAANADAALKKAKVDVAMSRAQLHKSLKALSPADVRAAVAIDRPAATIRSRRAGAGESGKQPTGDSRRSRTDQRRRTEASQDPVGHAPRRVEKGSGSGGCAGADRSTGASRD